MEVRFWGTRGSLPTPGPRTVRFGGNTACVEVRTGAGHVFIFDCGTGARPLGDALTARAPIGASILFSHTHWDHIDRKSTRLNSSHQIISYAVFWLKKK